MANIEHFNCLTQAFARLFQDLSAMWPKQNLNYAREEVEHFEFGEALENLIAVGLQNGKGFSPAHIHQIEDLTTAMEMTDSPLLLQLRQAGTRTEGHATA